MHPAKQKPAIEANSYTTSDSTILSMRSWQVKRPKAVVIAVHGFNDYSNAFEGAGRYFQKRGITTYAYDQRGFGSTPNRGIWAGEKNLTRDLAEFTGLIARRHKGVPLFLMGESMGGAVVMVTAAQEEIPARGIILLAPAVWGNEHMPVPYRMLLWGMAHTLPEYKLTGRGLKILASNNIPMLRAMGKDPLIIKATRVDTIYGLSHLMDKAYNSPPHIDGQVLLLYGFKDQVIPRKPVEEIKEHFPEPPDAVFYDEGYHMLTRDLQGDKVLADIARWIGKKAR